MVLPVPRCRRSCLIVFPNRIQHLAEPAEQRGDRLIRSFHFPLRLQLGWRRYLREHICRGLVGSTPKFSPKATK